MANHETKELAEFVRKLLSDCAEARYPATGVYLDIDEAVKRIAERDTSTRRRALEETAEMLDRYKAEREKQADRYDNEGKHVTADHRRQMAEGADECAVIIRAQVLAAARDGGDGSGRG